MLKDGYYMSTNEEINKYEDLRDELENIKIGNDLKLEDNTDRIINNSISKQEEKKILVLIGRYASPIFFQIFIMTFLAVSTKQICHFYSVFF